MMEKMQVKCSHRYEETRLIQLYSVCVCCVFSSDAMKCCILDLPPSWIGDKETPDEACDVEMTVTETRPSEMAEPLPEGETPPETSK